MKISAEPIERAAGITATIVLLIVGAPLWIFLGLVILLDRMFPRLREWTRWFAWRPVRIGAHLVWLETVERVYWDGEWLYRTLAEAGE